SLADAKCSTDIFRIAFIIKMDDSAILFQMFKNVIRIFLHTLPFERPEGNINSSILLYANHASFNPFTETGLLFAFRVMDKSAIAVFRNDGSSFPVGVVYTAADRLI